MPNHRPLRVARIAAALATGMADRASGARARASGPLLALALGLSLLAACSSGGGGGGASVTDPAPPPPVDCTASPRPSSCAPITVTPDPHFHRNTPRTLAEVADEQAARADGGVVREFAVTQNYFVATPGAAGTPPAWDLDSQASAGTVYLTPRSGGAHTLRMEDRSGQFTGTYHFAAGDGLSLSSLTRGAASALALPLAAPVLAADSLIWPEVVSGEHAVGITGTPQDFILAYGERYDTLATDSAAQTLGYAAYGWWSARDAAGVTNRLPLNAHGGLHLGLLTFARDMPGLGGNEPLIEATWSGRTTGHVLDAGFRWVFEGDVTLEATLQGIGSTIEGTVTNTRIAPLVAAANGDTTLVLDESRAGPWHDWTFLKTGISGNAYVGRATVTDPASGGGLPKAGVTGPTFSTPSGSYEGAFYGPRAQETAGQWYVREAYFDVAMGQMSVVGGFGARQSALGPPDAEEAAGPAENYDPIPRSDEPDEEQAALTEASVRTGPHLARDLRTTLPELAAAQAPAFSEQGGVAREFVATSQFLGQLPGLFLPNPAAPRWQASVDTPFLSATVFMTPRASGDHSFRISGSIGFSGDYHLHATDTDLGWGEAGAAFTSPELLLDAHPSAVNIPHDFVLAYTDELGAAESLDYAGYGWWALKPVRQMNPRALSALGGIGLGLQTHADDLPRDLTAVFRGRSTGHVLSGNIHTMEDLRTDTRWVFEGDATLYAELRSDTDFAQVSGIIRNTRIAPLARIPAFATEEDDGALTLIEFDDETFAVDETRAGDWHDFVLEATPIQGNGYRGGVAVGNPLGASDTAPVGFAGPRLSGTGEGAYEGVFYGPAAEETAGNFLWREGSGGNNEIVLAAGFGARRSDAPAPPGETGTLAGRARPLTLTENNYRVSRLEDIVPFRPNPRTFVYHHNARGSMADASLPGGFANPYALTLPAAGTRTDWIFRVGGNDYGYEGTYTFAEATTRVAGFRAARSVDILWQPVSHLKDVPSDTENDHDINLAVTSRSFASRDLQYARYGWWAITPYDTCDGPNDRTNAARNYCASLNAAGGIGVGLATASFAELPRSWTAIYRGTAIGHIGQQTDNRDTHRRFTLDGEVQMDFEMEDGVPSLRGAITNTRVIEVDPATMEVRGPAVAADWHDITFELSTGFVDGNGFAGVASASGPPGAGPDFRGADGFYFGRFYGPAAEEIAGEWGLRSVGSRAIVAGGFGAQRVLPTIAELLKPHTFTAMNRELRVMRLAAPWQYRVFGDVQYDVTLPAAGSGQDYVLRVAEGYGFQGAYTFRAAHRVAGFRAARSEAIVWQPVSQIDDIASPESGFQHDIIAAHTARASFDDLVGDLLYARYGWWAVSPTDYDCDAGSETAYCHTMNAGAGLAFGQATQTLDLPRDLTATYRGVTVGHISEPGASHTAHRRYTLDGEVEIAVAMSGAQPTFRGGLSNTRVVEVDHRTMEVKAGAVASDWHDVAFDLSTGLFQGNAFTGDVTVSGAPGAGPDFRGGGGYYFGRFYGPAAEEVAGEWQLLSTGNEFIAIGGFGARRATQIADVAKPRTFSETNRDVYRLNLGGTRFDTRGGGVTDSETRVTLPAADSGQDWVLQLVSGNGYEGTYTFRPTHRVAGFRAARSEDILWQPLSQIDDIESGSTLGNIRYRHDIISAFTARATADDSGADLLYARYGWWAVSPTDYACNAGSESTYCHSLNVGAGVAIGLATPLADLPREWSATYRGVTVGHIGQTGADWQSHRRFTLDGEVEVHVALAAGQPTFRGAVTNTRVIEVDHRTLEVKAGAVASDWHDIALDFSLGFDDGSGFRGRATASGTAGAGPDFTGGAGQYFGRFYGPNAEEVAGEWQLLSSDERSLAIGGFGARWERPAAPQKLADFTRPVSFGDANTNLWRLRAEAEDDGGHLYDEDAAASPYQLTLPAAASGLDAVLQLGGEHGYEGVYAFAAAEGRVSGFRAARSEDVTWQAVSRVDDVDSDARRAHDIAVSVAARADGGTDASSDLEYTRYGWWAVTPQEGDAATSTSPYRDALGAAGGIAVGEATPPGDLPDDLTATYTGIVVGHIGEQGASRAAHKRYTLDGEVELRVAMSGGEPTFTGDITNTRVVEVDRDTMAVASGASASDWHDIALELSTGLVDGNGFEGTATASGAPGAGPDFRGGEGFYFGRFYGPQGEEVAGEWGLRSSDDLSLAAGGFGAKKTEPEPAPTP